MNVRQSVERILSLDQEAIVEEIGTLDGLLSDMQKRLVSQEQECVLYDRHLCNQLRINYVLPSDFDEQKAILFAYQVLYGEVNQWL